MYIKIVTILGQMSKFRIVTIKKKVAQEHSETMSISTVSIAGHMTWRQDT